MAGDITEIDVRPTKTLERGGIQDVCFIIGEVGLYDFIKESIYRVVFMMPMVKLRGALEYIFYGIFELRIGADVNRRNGCQV